MNKTIKCLLLFFLLGFVATGCDNWLDVTSSKEVRSKDQFQSADGFEDALVGVYINLGDSKLYGKDMSWYLVDILSQQYEPFTSSSDYYRVQQYQYESSTAAPKLAALWEHSYNGIANINNIIHYIDKNGDVMDPVLRHVIKGELLGLRAFLHFDLMRLYGKGNLANRSGVKSELTIPYVTQYQKKTTPQRSYTETFDLMEQDINQAMDLLRDDPVYPDPERPDDYYSGINQNGFFDQRTYRMNYFAVEALKARVLAWEGGSQKMNDARKAAEDVIANGPAHLIDPDTYNIENDQILFPEFLFGIRVNQFDDIVNELLTASDRSKYNAVYLTSNMANDTYETSNVNVGPVDIRYNTFLDSQQQGFVSTKLYQDSDVLHYDTMPLMKLPEMYYIAAEYYANNGNRSKAVDDLNTVRKHRGIIESIPDTASQATVNEEIFKEYRKEYVSEGQLFFYYKRTGVKHFPGLSQNRTAGDDIYMIPYPESETNYR